MYTYDSNGNITQIVDASDSDAAKTTAYTYDNLNRLTASTATGALNGNNHSETYSYDALGNITNKSDQGSYTYAGNTGSRYENPDAVTSIGSNNYSYDRNGNLTSSPNLTNTWNYNNRLTQSVYATSITVSYGYDYSGERVKQSNGTTTTYYPNKNYYTDGTTPTKQVYANGILVATISGSGSSATPYILATDHLTGSSVSALATTNGGIDQVLDYYPFGGIRLNEQNTSFNEQRKFDGEMYEQ